MRASGTSSASREATFLIDCTRLCTKKTWPSRSSSRLIAAAICFSSYPPTNVSTGCRSSGGVRIVDISRIPATPIPRTHVHLGPQPLQVLLVLDPEPLLLVDDDQ